MYVTWFDVHACCVTYITSWNYIPDYIVGRYNDFSKVPSTFIPTPKKKTHAQRREVLGNRKEKKLCLMIISSLAKVACCVNQILPRESTQYYMNLLYFLRSKYAYQTLHCHCILEMSLITDGVYLSFWCASNNVCLFLSVSFSSVHWVSYTTELDTNTCWHVRECW